MNKEFPKKGLKVAKMLKRLKTGRKDWIYVFIGTNLTADVTDCIDYFHKHSNVITGIYFLPLSTYSVIKRLKMIETRFQKVSLLSRVQHALHLTNKQETDQIEIFMSDNKSGGMRQTIFLNGNIVLTRLLNNIRDNEPAIAAGNIEQEITNGIEYLNRLNIGSFSSNNITIYLIVSSAIKDNFISKKFRINIYSPYELAIKLNCRSTATKRDKIC